MSKPVRTTLAEQIMKAHQFLYYVESKSVWSDFEYDQFCKRHGLEGSGGSDLASDYAPVIVALAREIEKNPSSPSFSL